MSFPIFYHTRIITIEEINSGSENYNSSGTSADNGTVELDYYYNNSIYEPIQNHHNTTNNTFSSLDAEITSKSEEDDRCDHWPNQSER